MKLKRPEYDMELTKAAMRAQLDLYVAQRALEQAKEQASRCDHAAIKARAALGSSHDLPEECAAEVADAELRVASMRCADASALVSRCVQELDRANAAAYTVVEQIRRWDASHPSGTITKETLRNADVWTVLRGPVGPSFARATEWDLFTVSGYGEVGKRVLDELWHRGVQLVGGPYYCAPMIDGESTSAKLDDEDAVIAYLGEGGAVCLVPDSMTSKQTRWYAVARYCPALAEERQAERAKRIVRQAARPPRDSRG